ncbi:hypothetical protein KEM60_03047 [Austwickia sp. TVS 96-490-7B]|uniref:hypothetical protein n=1 Tax=Austwickia sp. TVS 96-490-7B TaxID=2830843 RepID=UPI001C56035F|nr:hypothetical protein [Austwickia sp. TVS 96-490-7B]MBW3086818.1 hypothetical protein [Austwickia sp. TVS 96-490-7B]
MRTKVGQLQQRSVIVMPDGAEGADRAGMDGLEEAMVLLQAAYGSPGMTLSCFFAIGE